MDRNFKATKYGATINYTINYTSMIQPNTAFPCNFFWFNLDFKKNFASSSKPGISSSSFKITND